MKKIAIPTVNDRINGHFGQAKEFTIYRVDEKQYTFSEKVQSTEGCGCRSNIIQILKNKGVNTLLAGNMGEGAYRKLQYAGLEVIRGCKGKTEQIISDYISGRISDTGELCQTHGSHHH